MRIKLLLFGEAVSIPKTSLGLGLGLLTVWVDGSGFTSGSNDLGALGYIFLETQEVDLGEIDAEKQALFANLHARVVTFDIKTNTFVKDGGIARIALTISVQQGAALVDEKLEFLAEDCRGVALLSNALSFSARLSQMERTLAELDEPFIVQDEELVALVDAAPSPDPDTTLGDGTESAQV